MSKLYRARSLLYRRQILQENIRWKALDEIYKVYMLLLRSDLNISANFRQTFSHFRQIFASFCHYRVIFSLIFAQILMKFYRNFANFLLFSVPMFPFSYHSFQTDPQADILENVEHS